MGVIPFWPRKHRYRCIGQRIYAGHTVSIYQCLVCEHVTWLERWQLRQLPWAVAQCRNGKALTFVEAFTLVCGGEAATSVDCYESGVTFQ